MIQIYGMRRPGGRVKHIVRVEVKPRKYSKVKALCGVWCDAIDLADTVGPTCAACMEHPKFNSYDETSGPYRNTAAPQV